jgi:hypothetical protein
VLVRGTEWTEAAIEVWMRKPRSLRRISLHGKVSLTELTEPIDYAVFDFGPNSVIVGLAPGDARFIEVERVPEPAVARVSTRSLPWAGRTAWLGNLFADQRLIRVSALGKDGTVLSERIEN